MNNQHTKKWSLPILVFLVVSIFSYAKYASADWQTSTNNNDIIHASSTGLGVIIMQHINPPSSLYSDGQIVEPLGFRISISATTTMGSVGAPICAIEKNTLQLRVYQSNDNSTSLYLNGNPAPSQTGTLIATLTNVDPIPDCAGYGASSTPVWVHFVGTQTYVLPAGKQYFFEIGTQSTATSDFSVDKVNGLGWQFTPNNALQNSSQNYDAVTYTTYPNQNYITLNPLYADTVNKYFRGDSFGACISGTVPYVYAASVYGGTGTYYAPSCNGNWSNDAYYYPDFSITGDVYALPSTTTPTSTPTYPVYTPDPNCGITSGDGIVACLKNAFYWAVLPPQSTFDQYAALMDQLKRKPPAGYFTAYSQLFDISTTTATSTIFVLVATDSPMMTYVFSPLRTALVVILYVFAAVWLFRRLKEIHL